MPDVKQVDRGIFNLGGKDPSIFPIFLHLYVSYRDITSDRYDGQPIFKMSSIEKYGGVEFVVVSIMCA